MVALGGGVGWGDIMASFLQGRGSAPPRQKKRPSGNLCIRGWRWLSTQTSLAAHEWMSMKKAPPSAMDLVDGRALFRREKNAAFLRMLDDRRLHFQHRERIDPFRELMKYLRLGQLPSDPEYTAWLWAQCRHRLDEIKIELSQPSFYPQEAGPVGVRWVFIPLFSFHPASEGRGDFLKKFVASVIFACCWFKICYEVLARLRRGQSRYHFIYR